MKEKQETEFITKTHLKAAYSHTLQLKVMFN